MTGERCELRHRLKEDSGTHEGKADVPVNGAAVVGSGVVSARLDMLVVGDTSVVRHIMPLIQCISGREQLARESQPVSLSLSLSRSLSRLLAS